ncbi:hypothetical protein ACLOJK_011676 [Asimina triloba]
MELAAQLKRGISRQFSTGSMKKTGKFSFRRQSSLDPRRNNFRFSFGRQSSLDPNRRSPVQDELAVPENLDSTMQLLFLACRGDVQGVQDLLDDGVDVNSIDLDGRTALHIAACEGHVGVVKLLLSRKANIDARDRWGSTSAIAFPYVHLISIEGYVTLGIEIKAAADAKYYGNVEIYDILRARGAKVPKTRKTPMVVSNPREVPEYEINPSELQLRRCDGISKAYPLVNMSRLFVKKKTHLKISKREFKSVVLDTGTYQVAKWNGTKVAVKILDKDCYSDPDSIERPKALFEPSPLRELHNVFNEKPKALFSALSSANHGDLGNYLQKKGRLQPSKSLRFALDIAM